MSQANVEVVRGGWDAFADRGLDALTEFLAPNVNYRAAEGAIDDVGEMNGSAAVRRYVQDWIEMFTDLTVVLEDVRDVGDDRVVAAQRVNGRAKVSGVETELRFAVVYTVRGGKIVRGREYMDIGRALEAAGLSE